MIFSALIAGITATAGAAVVLTLCYTFCRTILDRHRLAGWESAWIGPGSVCNDGNRSGTAFACSACAKRRHVWWRR